MSDLQLVTGSVYSLPPNGDPAFLLYFCTSSAKPGTAVSMSDAWSMFTGYFIVVPEAAEGSDLTALANAIAANAAFVPPTATSFAWTSWDSPNQKLAAPVILPLASSASGPVVAAQTALTAGRYGMWMQAGSPVTATVEEDGSIDHFTIAYAPPQLSFPAANGIGPVLPMGGAARFCFTGEGLIGDPTDDPQTGFDIAIRYFATNLSLRYALFEPWPDGYHLLVDLVWDPLMAFAGSGYALRTQYALRDLAFTIAPGQEAGTWVLTGAAAPDLPTCFRGRFGEQVKLQPLSGTTSPPAFVPQPLPDGTWYLVPSGDFSLSLDADPDGVCRLLGGLTGTEFFELDPLPSVLTFVPGQAAFATTANALDDTWTTAWARLSVPAGSNQLTPVYFTQPPAKPLFDQSGAGTVLPLFDVTLCDVDPSAAFPIAPYAQASGDAAPYIAFESGVLAPARKTIVAKAGGNVVSSRARIPGVATQTTTPQGFLVDVDGTTWTNLQLANDGTSSFGVANVSDALRIALQSPQLFLVVTQPIDTLQPSLSIAGWPFQINVGTNGTTGQDQFHNVLIFKFCDGSVLDRINDPPSSWTDASSFNDPATLAQLQSWLRTYVDTAIQSGDSALDPFNALVQDPAWNGVLALRVDVTEALPGNLQGIVAGINLTQFYGHHVGIDVTPVPAPGQAPPPSSLFALIDYADLDPSTTVQNRPTPTAGGAETTAYSFRVLTVLARFANSQIVTFESEIVLTMTQLFSEPVQLQLPAGAAPVEQNSISLAGHLEMHDGAPVYTFSGDQVARFLYPSSNIFYYADVTTSQFQTLGVTSDGSVSTVSSRFSLWGFFSFKPTPGIDIFSFGNDPAAPPSGAPSRLAYANLGIDMSFQLVDPPQPTVVFTFDPSAISFDPDQSTARASTADTVTLYTALPLQLDTILSGSGVLPQQNGFLSVVAPAISGVAGLVPQQWYGLSMMLNLGTTGALDSLASFNATLLAAWSPGGIVQQVALVMQLPGTAPGKSDLSLQSVLRLAVGQISAAVADGNIALTLSNVGLVFLGVTLPRGAAINVALIGNSDAVTTSSLGWYATYAPNTTTKLLEGGS